MISPKFFPALVNSLLLIVAPSVLSADVSFHAHRDFIVPAPGIPAQGDMNGDGIPDLIVPGSSNISLLLGKGDGTFQAPIGIESGAAPFAVVTGDFNGDGILDIAAGTSSGVSIILGEGGGKFGTPIILPAGKSPQRSITADLNGDHILDVAVANFDSNDISIFFGKGDGSFVPGATIQVGMGPLGIAAADINRDGRADLVVTNSGTTDGLNSGPNGSTIAIILGGGKGTFRPAVLLPLAHTPEGIAISDFNRDGKLDLMIALTATDQVAELLGNGDGTFKPARLFTVFPQSRPVPADILGPKNVALADFDGDGNIDLAVANSLTSTVGILFGDGTGNFIKPYNIEVSQAPMWVLAGDYNRDGKADFISSNNSANNISVVIGNGDGTFVDAPHFVSGPQPVTMLAADFNEDGMPDVATAGSLRTSTHNMVSIQLAKPGRLAPPNIITLKANIAAMVAADINQDGHLDLLAVNFGSAGADPGGITMLLGKGDGTFQAAQNIPAGTNPLLISVADFNGDGKPDAVLANRFFGSTNIVDSINFFPGDGKGGFGAPSNIVTLAPFAGAAVLLAGDFNGDGKQDIAYVVSAGRTTFSVQFGNGDGTFQPAKVPTSVPPTVQIFAVSSGDFNNDGIPDFAVEESGVVEMLLADGKGGFVSKGKFPDNGLSGFSFIPALVLADFNGDGLLDVAAADGFSDDVAILFGNGDGTLGAPALIIDGGHTAAAVFADFNGDGRPDIVLATTVPTASPTSPGEVILLLNTTPK